MTVTCCSAKLDDVFKADAFVPKTPLGLKRELTYDEADNVIKDTDNLDRTYTYEYDIMHRMTKSENPEGGVTEYGYDIRGNRNQVKDALNYTWNYQYDLIDQMIASVDPEEKATEMAYNLVRKLASVIRPGDRTTRFTYDGNYNVTAVTDPLTLNRYNLWRWIFQEYYKAADEAWKNGATEVENRIDAIVDLSKVIFGCS